MKRSADFNVTTEAGVAKSKTARLKKTFFLCMITTQNVIILDLNIHIDHFLFVSSVMLHLSHV